MHMLVERWHAIQLNGSKYAKRRARKHWAEVWHALVAASADPRSADALGRTAWQLMRELGVEDELTARLEATAMAAEPVAAADTSIDGHAAPAAARAEVVAAAEVATDVSE